MMKKILIIMALCLFIASGCFSGENDVAKLPKGYSVLCSVSGDKFALKFPDGSIAPMLWDTKRKAISFAVYYDSWMLDPTKKYKWSNCGKGGE